MYEVVHVTEKITKMKLREKASNKGQNGKSDLPFNSIVQDYVTLGLMGNE